MIVIDDNVLKQAGVPEAEIRLGIAVLLYEKEVYSLSRAAEYAGVNRFEFEGILAGKGLNTIRTTPEELEQQVKSFEQIHFRK